MEQANILISINVGILFSIIGFGYKLTRAFNRMEFKIDLMWSDYRHRTGNHDDRPSNGD